MAFQLISASETQAVRVLSAVPGLQIITLFIGFAGESRQVWLGCLLAAAALAIVGGWTAMRRRRLIGDTPTSKIASAAQGYVELQGTGKPFPDNPVRSPLDGFPCLWFRQSVEEKDHDGKWQVIHRPESDVSFILDDGTGTCLIDPDGAEIITHRREQRVRDGYRITEWKLVERDAIYALGEFRTYGGHHLELDPKEDLKALLADWKNNPQALREKYDLDGNGEISDAEWELVRAAAKREVRKQHQEARLQTDSHTLKKPRDGRHFLISSLDPDKLARRYGLWASFHLFVFFGALVAIPWTWWRFP